MSKWFLSMPVVAMLFFSMACTATPADESSQPACHAFRWLPFAAQDHGGVAVNVMINGRSVWMQLDTGATESVLYAKSSGARSLGLPLDAQTARGILRSGGADPRSLRFNVNAEMGDNSDTTKQRDPNAFSIAGTLGLDALVGRIAVFDFGRAQFCLHELADAPARDPHAASIPARIEHGRIFIPLKVGKHTFNGFFYDSGSSLFFAVTDQATWRAITGRSIGQATEHASVPSWGKSLAFVGAPASDDLYLGKQDVGKTRVFTTQQALDLFDAALGEQGVVGNAPFEHGKLMIDLGPIPRLLFTPPSGVSELKPQARRNP